MHEMITRALIFAAHKHRDQRREDPEQSPYINHPIAVMSILALEAKIDDPVVLSAALLHDTLEDTDTTVEELKEVFGDEITNVVIELTDDQALPRAERYAMQKQKAMGYSPEAKLIRIADKIANTRDAYASPPSAWSVDRLEGHFTHSYGVMALLRETNAQLETLFDEIYHKTADLIKKLRNPD